MSLLTIFYFTTNFFNYALSRFYSIHFLSDSNIWIFGNLLFYSREKSCNRKHFFFSRKYKKNINKTSSCIINNYLNILIFKRIFMENNCRIKSRKNSTSKISFLSNFPNLWNFCLCLLWRNDVSIFFANFHREKS